MVSYKVVSIFYYKNNKGVILYMKPFCPKMLPINLSDKDLLSLYKKALEANKKLTEFSVLLESV